MRLTSLHVSLLLLTCSLGGCSGRGLPYASAPADFAAPPIDVAMAPGDLAMARDLAQPPPTITFEVGLRTGGGVTYDGSQLSMPLPTPTVPPIDGISYEFNGGADGVYDFELTWQDTANENRGWTASFGGAPGVSPNWPLTHMSLTLTDGGPTRLGLVKVALVAGSDAQPNTLIFSIRRVDAPTTDYGVLYLKVAGN